MASVPDIVRQFRLYYISVSTHLTTFKGKYCDLVYIECGGIFNNTENSGLIESPGFSDNMTYNASEQCVWVITNRNQNSSIEVRFLALDLETQGECSYDFVEIREGIEFHTLDRVAIGQMTFMRPAFHPF